MIVAAKFMEHIKYGPYQLLQIGATTKVNTKTLKQLKLLRDIKVTENEIYHYLKARIHLILHVKNIERSC